MKRVTKLCISLLVLGALGGSLLPTISAHAAVQIPDEVLAEFRNKPTARYIVELSAQADLSSASTVPDRDTRRVAVVDALREVSDQSQAGLRQRLEAGLQNGSVTYFHPLWVANMIVVESDEAILHEIAARPEVEAIWANEKVTLIPTSPDETGRLLDIATAEWNISRVGAPDAWAAGIDGSGAVVANIDTGVDWMHPAIADGYRGADGDHNYDWFDAINGQSIPYDDNAHGTHTMGTSAGGDGNGSGVDDIGVAPGATWIAVKAFYGGGYGYVDDLLEAGQWIAAPTRQDGTNPDPTMAPDVVNNSWGGGRCQGWYEEVITTWRTMGIFPAFANGNSGPSSGSVGYPADSTSAFGVGATDSNDQIAWFSSRGPSCHSEIKPEISAPGVSVRSSVPGGGFSSFSGTSMATPHIAGTVALLVQASAHGLSVDQTEGILQTTALDLGTPGADNDYGSGRLQSYQAVLQALQGGTLEGVVTDVADGTLLSGATIRAQSGDRVFNGLSREDGTYTMRLPAGLYQVRASKFGFITSAPVDVRLREHQRRNVVQNFALGAAPPSTITGTVRSSVGALPLAGATVKVLNTPIPPTTADPQGQFTIQAPAGKYTMEASQGRCFSAHRQVVDSSGGSATADFDLAPLVDAWGYTCQQVTSAWEPGIQRLNLSGDDNSTLISLPFAFSWYETDYTQAYVHTNGLISFRDSYPNYSNTSIPNSGQPNAAVFGFWDDLYMSPGGVYVATLGVAPNRRFILEYRDVGFYYTSGFVTFAIVLGEDGSVETRYRAGSSSAATGSGATSGIENELGTIGLQFSLNESVLVDGLAVRYLPPPPTLPSEPLDLVATSSGPGRIQLTWNAPTDLGRTSLREFRIYRDTTEGFTPSEGNLYATTSGAARSFLDTELQNGTRFYYKLSAVNRVGESPASNQASAETPSVPSDDCTTTHLNGYVSSAFVLLESSQPDERNTWVCFRVRAQGRNAGGKLVLTGATSPVPPTVDDDWAACRNATPVSPVPPLSGSFGAAGDPGYTTFDLSTFVDTVNQEVWVCGRVTTAGQDVGKRLRFPLLAGARIAFVSDPNGAGPDLPHPGNTDLPSTACQNGGGARVINLNVSGTNLWLYSLQQGSVAHLCVRVQGAANTGGRLTINTTGFPGITPSILTSADNSDCLHPVLDNANPAIKINRSDSTNPASICVKLGTGSWLRLTAGLTGSPQAPTVTWNTD